jgi:hypothetical protein
MAAAISGEPNTALREVTLTISKGRTALDQMMAERNFVELWRLKLNGGKSIIETATLLFVLNWREHSLLHGSASYTSGYWTVILTRPLLADRG